MRRPASSSLLGLTCFLCLTVAPAQAELIFRTGFEAGTQEELRGTPSRIYRLDGADLSVEKPNHWKNDLQAGGRDLWFNYVDITDGANFDMLGARIERDPTDSTNRVFYTWQKDSETQTKGYDSRVQGELLHYSWPEFHYKIRFRLGADIALGDQESAEDLGLSLIEVGGEPHTHMSRLLLHKWGSKRAWSNGKAAMTWRAEVKTPDSNHTFYVASTKRPRYGQWQTLEFYVKAGHAGNGRYLAKVDGEVLFDTLVRTRDTGNWSDAGILKVYGGNLVRFLKSKGKMTEVWFDDMEIRNALPGTPTTRLSPAPFAAAGLQPQGQAPGPWLRLPGWKDPSGFSVDMQGRRLPGEPQL